MVIARGPRRRPDKMQRQRQVTKAIVAKSGIEIKPTFDHKMTAYDFAIRRFQKRRFNPKVLIAMYHSKDPVLKKLARDRISHLKPKTLAKIGLPHLVEMILDYDFIVKIAATNAIVSMGEKAIPDLRKLAQDQDLVVRITVADVIAKIYANKEKEGASHLKKLIKDPNSDMHEAATKEIAKISEKRLLLSERMPFVATPHLPEVLKRTKDLKTVSKQLKDEFGDGYTGLVVFGSIAKGYATPKSDVDYAVIGSNPEIAKRFRVLSKEANLPLCFEHYVNPEKHSDLSNVASLFYGLFFGDRKLLRQAQKEVFSKMTEEEWTEIRQEILYHETNLYKAFERFWIRNPREQQRLKAAAALRVPPPYKEMKKLLGLNEINTK